MNHSSRYTKLPNRYIIQFLVPGNLWVPCYSTSTDFPTNWNVLIIPFECFHDIWILPSFQNILEFAIVGWFKISFYSFDVSHNSNQFFQRFYLCCGFLISLVSASQGPKSGKLTSFGLFELKTFLPYFQIVLDYQLMTLLLLEVFIEILHQLLPFFIFHLRCCPIESDPTPPLFPSPSDQFSLDTERSK